MSRQFSFLLLASFAVSASATVLSPETALNRAIGSPDALPLRMSAQASGAVAPRLAMTVAPEGAPMLYVFNGTGEQGFLVVSASDLIDPVLGYADAGAFDPADMPPAMQAWLDFYAAEIAAAETSAADTGAMKITRPERKPIAPMLTTRWDQDAPYNNSCPKIGSDYTYTGCVATAVAQVLNYREYPVRGTGNHSYIWRNKNLSFDYGATEFQWDKMLDTYTSSATAEQKAAVAQLMYAVGVSADMNYGTDASGAIAQDAVAGLVRNFGYDKSVVYLMRDWYGILDWEALVYEQLTKYGPIYYDGVTNDNMGHAFVCDGYDTDGYFHFNWGWSGMSDGYFRLTALDPGLQGIGGASSAFNYMQGIIADLRPAEAGSSVVEVMAMGLASDATFTASTASTSKGGSVKFTAGDLQNVFYNCGYTTISNLYAGAQFTSAASGEVSYSNGESKGDFEPYQYFRSFSVKIPTSLTDGTYYVRPAFKSDDSDWCAMRVPAGQYGYLVMTVSGESVTISHPQGMLTVDNIEILSPVYAGSKFKLRGHAVNAGDNAFYGTVQVALCKKGSTSATAIAADELLLDVAAGGNDGFDYISTFSSRTPAGDYDLYFIDSDNRIISEPVSVKLRNAPAANEAEVTDITVTDINGVDPLNMQVTATLTCNSGFFADAVQFVIFRRTGGSALTSLKSTDEMYFLEEGESTTVTFKGQFTSGTAGTRYMGIVYSASGEKLSSGVVFTVGESGGITEIGADGDNSPVRYYDLQGRPVADPQPGDVYIMVTGTKAVKTVY